MKTFMLLKSKAGNKSAKDKKNDCKSWMGSPLLLILYYIFLSGLICIGFTCHPDKPGHGEIVYPKLINSHSAFRYPAEAYRQSYQGKVVIRILVAEDGTISAAQIYKSSGYKILDQAALDIAKTSVFKPGTVDGIPQELWVLIPVDFHLNSEIFVEDEIEKWWDQTQNYFSVLASDSSIKRDEFLRQIFYHYQSMVDFIENSRTLKANKFILNMVRESMHQQWLEFDKIWPLGFLLYLDYEARFPDSPNKAIVEDELIACLDQEIKFLENEIPPPARYAELYQLLSGLLKSIHDKKWPN